MTMCSPTHSDSRPSCSANVAVASAWRPVERGAVLAENKPSFTRICDCRTVILLNPFHWAADDGRSAATQTVSLGCEDRRGCRGPPAAYVTGQSIDVDGLSGHVGGGVTCQEQHRLGDVFGLADPGERNMFEVVGADRVVGHDRFAHIRIG